MFRIYNFLAMHGVIYSVSWLPILVHRPLVLSQSYFQLEQLYTDRRTEQLYTDRRTEGRTLGLFKFTRISGRYAPFILAPAEGLPSCACKGSLHLLTLLSKGVTMYTTIYITEIIICNYRLFPFFAFSNCQIFPLTS